MSELRQDRQGIIYCGKVPLCRVRNGMMEFKDKDTRRAKRQGRLAIPVTDFVKFIQKATNSVDMENKSDTMIA